MTIPQEKEFKWIKDLIDEYQKNPIYMPIEMKEKEDDKFKRTTPHKCQRCGLCCQGRGDLSFTELDRDWGDCCALQFDGKLAMCIRYNERRGCCRQYPEDEWCDRELKEKGLWEEFLKN